VLLLDEIEKAHPDLFNILLQVMDNGRLTDHHGKTVDFRNVILIMTTNAGASDMARESIGFGKSTREDVQEEAVKRMFTPEFRNRLDAIVSLRLSAARGGDPRRRQVHPATGIAACRPQRPHPARRRCPRMAHVEGL
jgi:ATP-dependent Clp protease ATP-binding subunit ClpA